MTVQHKKGWYIASIGGLSACDKDRLAAMVMVTRLFDAGLKRGASE